MLRKLSGAAYFSKKIAVLTKPDSNASYQGPLYSRHLRDVYHIGRMLRCATLILLAERGDRFRRVFGRGVAMHYGRFSRDQQRWIKVDAIEKPPCNSTAGASAPRIAVEQVPSNVVTEKVPSVPIVEEDSIGESSQDVKHVGATAE